MVSDFGEGVTSQDQAIAGERKDPRHDPATTGGTVLGSVHPPAYGRGLLVSIVAAAIVFALAIFVYLAFPAHEIFADVKFIPETVVTVTFRIHKIAQHIHRFADAERDIAGRAEKPPDKAEPGAPACAFVSQAQIIFLARAAQMLFDEKRRFQYKIVADHYRHDEDFLRTGVWSLEFGV